MGITSICKIMGGGGTTKKKKGYQSKCSRDNPNNFGRVFINDFSLFRQAEFI